MNLQQEARQMADYYKNNPKLEIIFLGGSVSRGWEDRYSDIELFLFWKESPTDEDRLRPIRKAEGEILSFFPYEDLEWSETYLVNGTKFEISSFLTKTVEQFTQDMKNGDLSLEKQCLIGAVADGKPFIDETRFQELYDRIFPYPEQLKKGLIEQAFDFGGPWQSREALIDRGDVLLLQKTLADIGMKLLLSLQALNHQYIHHPGMKWLKETSDRLKWKPDRFYERMTTVFYAENPTERVRVLEQLIQEALQLVQKHNSGVDFTVQMRQAHANRPGVKSS